MKHTLISVLLVSLAGCASFDAAIAKPSHDVRDALSAAAPYLAHCELLPNADARLACADVADAAKRLGDALDALDGDAGVSQ